jgi:hypothetical protein
MALPTTVLNPTQIEAKRFTNRKGTLWLQKPGTKPSTAASRHGIKVGLQGRTAKALSDAAFFSGGAAMAAASMVIQIPTTITTPTAGAWFEVVMPFTLNGVVRAIKFGVQVQSADTYAEILADMDALLTAVNNGDALPANSYVKGLGRDDSRTVTLKAAMENMFGTTEATAFVVASDLLTLLLGTNGTDGNKFWLAVNLLNSLPSPLAAPDANGVPQLENCFSPGDFTDFDLQGPTQSVNYTPGNTLVPITIPTSDTITIATGVYFIVSKEVLDKISSAVHWSATASASVGIFGANTAAEKLRGTRVIFVWENDNGTYDYIDLYDCLFLNFAQKLTGTAADALAVSVNPQPTAGRLDTFGYELLED